MASSERIAERAWFARHPVEVAWDLIGCVLRVTRGGETVSGRIVETEAYAGSDDQASHAGRLRVARETMTGPPGTAYVYLSYGVHTMLNIVCHVDGEAGAVLLRAVEPLEGSDVMRGRRGGFPGAAVASGPGSLGQAMGIRLADIGADLVTSDTLSILQGEPRGAVHASPRIGITRATDALWRFFEHPSRFVSRHRRGVPVNRQDLPTLIPPVGTPLE